MAFAAIQLPAENKGNEKFRIMKNGIAGDRLQYSGDSEFVLMIGNDDFSHRVCAAEVFFDGRLAQDDGGRRRKRCGWITAKKRKGKHGEHRPIGQNDGFFKAFIFMRQ